MFHCCLYILEQRQLEKYAMKVWILPLLAYGCVLVGGLAVGCESPPIVNAANSI